MIVVAVIIALVFIGAILFYSFPIVEVCGDSMYPTYKDGEYILSHRFFRKSKLKIGDVIIFDSEDSERIVIKRIAHIRRNPDKSISFYVLGDNPEVSYDSRYYGWIDSDCLICKPFNQRRKA